MDKQLEQQDAVLEGRVQAQLKENNDVKSEIFPDKPVDEIAHMVSNQEQFKFTKQEIFCISIHLQRFIDIVDNKLEDYVPCNACKFITSCFKDKNPIYQDVINKLAKITGLDYLVWARVK